MKKLLATICAGAVLGLMASCDDAPGKAKAYNQGINIIPTPVSLTQNEGNFKLNKNTKIYASTPEAKTVAEFFAAKMNTATGYQIATADKETSDGISLVIDGALDVNDEGYTLDVADSGVRIKAKTPQGLFYGMQSFLQLLPAEIESPSAVKGIAWIAPAVSIKDEPRFGYRGIMLDPCRHFIPVENIKKQLDVLALFKINRMHWHLTDDQARAIENECFVVIAGSVGNLPRVHNMDIQYAQSGVFTPCDFAFPTDGKRAEATPNTEMILVSDVDLDLLNELHTYGSVRNLRDRRHDLYELRVKKQ